MDPTASAALDGIVIKPVFMAFVDFPDEPLRANTSGADLALTGTGEPDIDGFVFSGIAADVVDIGPVHNGQNGSDSLVIKLSAAFDMDPDMLDEVNDRTHWQGREVRLWRIIRNAANVQQGGVQHYYTGYMSSLAVKAMPESQTIEATVEGYLAAFSAPSNRTYDNELFDSGDLSYRAAIAIANGNTGNPILSNTQTRPAIDQAALYAAATWRL